MCTRIRLSNWGGKGHLQQRHAQQNCYDGGNVTISDLSVSDVDFAGIVIWDCGDVSVTDSTITNCSTSGPYPALGAYDTDLDLENCTFSQAGLALEYGQSDDTTRRSLEVNGTHFSSGGYALVSGDLNFDLSGSRNAIPVTYLEGTLRDDTTLPSGQCFGTTYGLLGQALYSMQESEYGALGQALRNVQEPEDDVLSRTLYDTQEHEHFTIDSGATLSVQGGTSFVAKSNQPATQ